MIKSCMQSLPQWGSLHGRLEGTKDCFHFSAAEGCTERIYYNVFNPLLRKAKFFSCLTTTVVMLNLMLYLSMQGDISILKS